MYNGEQSLVVSIGECNTTQGHAVKFNSSSVLVFIGKCNTTQGLALKYLSMFKPVELIKSKFPLLLSIIRFWLYGANWKSISNCWSWESRLRVEKTVYIHVFCTEDQYSVKCTVSYCSSLSSYFHPWHNYLPGIWSCNLSNLSALLTKTPALTVILM